MRDPAVADVLADFREVETIDGAFATLLRHSMESCGARRAAVLQRDALDALHVVHEVNAALPDRMVIGDVRARLWTVLLGRSTLWWGAEDVPDPFRSVAGWETGLVVRLAARSGHPRLLVLADSDDPEVADHPESWCGAIAMLADLAAPIIDNFGLLAAAGRVRGLLRRVTALAGQLATADSPAELLNRLVDGLVTVEMIQSATVWSRDDDDGVVAAADRHRTGTPPTDILTESDARRRVLGVLMPTTGPAMQKLLGDAAPLADGRLLTLLPIPQAGRHVLGIVHPEPLDSDAREVFSTLVGSIGPALRQAEMGGERRSLVAGLSDVLRPQIPPTAIDIGVEYHPNTTAAEAFGGDFYDWFEPADNRILLAIGDVAGKGIPAAAAASMTTWSLRALGRQGPTPATLAHLLDQVVGSQLGADRFITLCLVDIDTQRWTARMVLAGHPAPMLLGPGSDQPEFIADRPLGVWADGPAFTTHEVHIEPGAVLLVFTDGITEAESPDGHRIGRDLILTAAEAAYGDGSRRASEIVRQVWLAVHTWAGGSPDDDCAMIAVRRPA